MANFDMVPVLRFNSLNLESYAETSPSFTTSRNLHRVNTRALESYLLA